ncbi:hypothetical protein [Methanobrevibacter olleyae]|uniref:Uncharacterized protein n=1 Tax=Methanobrevibacter olleyae TaxID=294671 RepID=A0A126R0W0_METOL|nr:hypothetical protein [Methanobrevibacter olleyae]AMK15717.1 hypothetical protein YLM1_1160 [Methanobrevibacter olleyae]SFL77546.1 hypothetical protein SAMN02910297_01726 [Methanobrevibacter olleyae]
MKLSKWIKLNNIPNNRILKILEDYEKIEPISFNNPEDVKAEVEGHGLRWVANKYGVSEKELKEYGWRFKKRDVNGKRRKETPIIKTDEQKPLVDIFDD